MRIPFGRPRASVPSIPSAPSVEAPVPPTLADVVRRLQFVRGYRRADGTLVGMAFCGAELAGHDRPTMAVLLRTDDGRAWGDLEPQDAMTDPEAQATRMIRRAARATDGGRSMLPVLDALHGMCVPNGDAAGAGQTNMAVAISCAGKVLEEAGLGSPTDMESFREAQRASFDQTMLLVGVAGMFEATLDPEALALARSRRVRLRDVDGPGLWEAMDRTFDLGAPVARAMRASPGLARAIAWAFEDDREGFEAALADGRLEAYLAPRTGLPKRLWAAPSALGDVTAEMPEESLPPTPSLEDPLVHWVGRLALLPPEWVPRDELEWRAYLECQPALRWALERSRDPSHLRVMLNRGPGWCDFLDRLEQATDGEDLATALRGVGDATEALARQVLVPALALDGRTPGRHSPDPSAAADAVLASGRSVTRVLEGSTRWHAVQHGIAARLTELSEDFAEAFAWMPGLPDAVYGDHEVVVLKDARAVVDEGRRGTNADGSTGLSHCVGGYVRRCEANESRILSVRRVEADGRRVRLSTAEIVPEVTDRGMTIRLSQHLGERNGRPSVEARGVLDRYMRELREGCLDVEVEALYPKVRSGDPKVQAGYDFEAPGAWETARDLWRDILPKAALDMDAATFAGATMAVVEGREKEPWEPVWEPVTFGAPGWPEGHTGGPSPSR